MADTLQAFSEYARHPDFRHGQKQPVDLSQLTGWDEDYLELMKMQAKKAETFTGNNAQPLITFYAPTEILARVALCSWEPFSAVGPTIMDTEQQALAILGVPHTTRRQLLKPAG